MRSILFVCLGNICRSPLAEGIAKAYSSTIRVDSAGTSRAHQGEHPCANSVHVAKKHGINIASLTSRQVTPRDFERFDIIIALDSNNQRDLEQMGAKGVRKLGEFGFQGNDVPDPYYFNGLDGFEEVFNMIEVCVKNLLDEL